MSENLIKVSISQKANKAFISLKLPWRGTHICRHTFATLALMATRDLSAVQANKKITPKITHKMIFNDRNSVILAT